MDRTLKSLKSLRGVARCLIYVIFVACMAIGGPELHAQTVASLYTTGYRFDAMRRLVGVISPSKDVAPDPANPTAPPAGPFLAERYTYDALGQLISVEKGFLSSWRAETVQPVNWTDFTLDNRVEYRYDAAGNKVMEALSDGATTFNLTQYAYDANSRLICTAVRMNTAAFASILQAVSPADPCKRTTQGPQGADRVTANIYDAAGQIVQIRRGVEDASGLWGCPSNAVQPCPDYSKAGVPYATYSYTPSRKLEYLIEASGAQARYVYDGFDRLSRWYHPSTLLPPNFNGNTPALALGSAGTVADYEEYTYDPNGNRLTLRKRDNGRLKFDYDDLNRLTTKSVVSTGISAVTQRPVSYAYDLLGRQTGAFFDGLAGADKVANTYDTAGRIRTTIVSMTSMTRKLTFEYDENGNRTRIYFPDHNTNKTAYVGYAYDGLDRPSTILRSDDPAGASPVAAYSYANDGTRLTFNSGPGATGALNTGTVRTQYSYDGAGRLRQLINDPTVNAPLKNTFSFFNIDAMDNEVGSYNAANQIITRTTSNNEFVYTAALNVDSSFIANGLNCYRKVDGVTNTCDRNGNLITDSTDNWVYDVENRLVNANPVVLGTEGSHNAALTYDPLGRLYEIRSYDLTDDQTPAPTGGNPNPPPPTPVKTTRFIYAGDELMVEYDKNGAIQHRYIHGGSGESDDPIAWYVGAAYSVSAGRNERLMRADWQGSISLITDSSGNAAWASNAYDDYGMPYCELVGIEPNRKPDCTRPAANQGRFQYTGQAYLQELGVYYYKARMYSPVHGRFMQVDPIGYMDQFNLYSYVGNDPVNGVDPSGTCGADNPDPNDRAPCPKEIVATARREKVTLPDLGTIQWRGQTIDTPGNYADNGTLLQVTPQSNRCGAVSALPASWGYGAGAHAMLGTPAVGGAASASAAKMFFPDGHSATTFTGGAAVSAIDQYSSAAGGPHPWVLGAAVGLGGFFSASNATSQYQLQGPFHTLDISVPFADAQISWGGGIWEVSAGPAASGIGGIASYDTYTAVQSGGCKP